MCTLTIHFIITLGYSEIEILQFEHCYLFIFMCVYLIVTIYLCVYLIVKIYMHISYQKYNVVNQKICWQFKSKIFCRDCNYNLNITTPLGVFCFSQISQICLFGVMRAIVRRGANYIITLIALNVNLLIKNQLSLHNIVKTQSAQNFMHTVGSIIIGEEPLLVNMLVVCGQ